MKHINTEINTIIDFHMIKITTCVSTGNPNTTIITADVVIWYRTVVITDVSHIMIVQSCCDSIEGDCDNDVSCVIVCTICSVVIT